MKEVFDQNDLANREEYLKRKEEEADFKARHEGVVDWLHENGTGEQAQEEALHRNLNSIQKKLSTIVSDYQTNMIEDEEAKKVIESAKKFLLEIESLIEKKTSPMRDEI
jgi:hypothetical protein